MSFNKLNKKLKSFVYSKGNDFVKNLRSGME